jgi:hypothetical protein
MIEFQELKKDILERAELTNACSDEYKRACNATTKEELFRVIVDNIIWCYENEMLNTPYMIKNFGELFDKFNVYATGHHVIKNKNIVLLGDSSTDIKIRGGLSSSIKMLDSAFAHVETFGVSSATLEMYGDSSANVETCANSSATLKMYGNSSATYKIKGVNSIIRDFTQSKIFVKESGFDIEKI